MNKKLSSRRLSLYIAGVSIAWFSASCNGTKNQPQHDAQLAGHSEAKPDIPDDAHRGKGIFEKDSALQALRTERSNERLANAGDDSAIIASMEALTPKANSSTSIFTIDENTGQTEGCPKIKLMEVYEEKDYGKVNNAGAHVEFSSLPDAFQKNIISKITSSLDEVRSQADTGEDDSSPESYISDLFKLGHTYLVALGTPHGGGIKMLLFFDDDGATLKQTSELGAELYMPIFYINKPRSHFGLSSGVSGPIYVYDSSGNLLLKDDFNKLTGDNGTSYGPVVVSDRFEYMLLANNISYLYKGKNVVLKTVGHSFYINDADDILSYGVGRHQWAIQDIHTGAIIYQMNNPELRLLFNNSNQYFFQSIANKKIYRYEIK
ncbi:MAG: hypothetical protein H6564_10025 [Lewinellaceae bacterium]|nr:hypothetical protein [Lewinellaceae bacterium]